MHIKRPFHRRLLDTVIGGVSALDIPRLDIPDLERAHKFIANYGYNLDNQVDREKVWSIHGRAVALIRDSFLEQGEVIPEIFSNPEQLKDIGNLLLYASQRVSQHDHGGDGLQRWACAILRVMHVIVHLNHDLTELFLDDIQRQVLSPIQARVYNDPATGSIFLGQHSDWDQVRLYRFDVKPLKASDSSIIKLLAKPNLVALNIHDRVGVRFVTRSLFDAFRVIRYLLESEVISFPHIIPNESANTLYPVNVFIDAIERLRGQEEEIKPEEIDVFLVDELKRAEATAEYREKANIFSSRNYRFIKFINRRLISVKLKDGAGETPFTFFYPFEIQVMDYETYLNNISGPAAHDKYKDRQRLAARKRILGEGKL